MAVGVKAKLLLTILSLFGSLPYRDMGVLANDSLIPHLTYSFQHANIWHMLANLFVLWNIKQKMNVVSGFLIAVAASFLPMFTDRSTVGMSGLLFAMFGIMWGERGDFKGCLKAGMPVILIMMVIPGINGLLHLYCYLFGYIWFKLFSYTKKVIRLIKKGFNIFFIEN